MAANNAPTFVVNYQGKVLTEIGSYSRAKDVFVQSDGKIVVVGDALGAVNNDFALARYNTDGKLDKTFGLDGIVTSHNDLNIENGEAVATQSDGKIILVGSITGSSINGVPESKFAINRYHSDGSLDTTFNGGAVSTVIKNSTSNNASNDFANAVTIQADGKILVAGSSGLNGATNADLPITGDFAIARYNSNGTLDTTFDSDGIVTTSFAGMSQVTDINVQADGKVLAYGFSRD